MNKIYRIRPANSFTIEELTEPHLWFSKPTAYKDSEDANVFSFIENNESIKESLDRLYVNSEKIAKDSKHIGICCFTLSKPPINIWKEFPKGHNGILIEFDKSLIEAHLQNIFGLGNAFNNVEYSKNPTLFKQYSKHDILWEIGIHGEYYKALKQIEKSPILRDELFRKMFTRINDRFSSQNESRIILGGENIPVPFDSSVNGYKVTIPKESILNVETHPTTSKEFLEELNSLNLINKSC